MTRIIHGGRTRSVRWLWTGALAILMLSGCSSLAVMLGLRVRLDKIPVATLSARLVSNRDASKSVTGLGPGQSARLIIVATDTSGKTYITVGAGNGKVALDNYTLTAEVVQIKRSKVSLAGAAGTIAITVDPAAQPYLKALTCSNRSGNGVPGPQPTITTAQLTSLW
jgi:hypothetical protein